MSVVVPAARAAHPHRLLPAGVALARLYRGVHHPTDIASSVLLAAAWLTAVWFILRPAPAQSSVRVADDAS